jgi:hypothetical protein
MNQATGFPPVLDPVTLFSVVLVTLCAAFGVIVLAFLYAINREGDELERLRRQQDEKPGSQGVQN